jgi:RHH-type transcriptional regulator, proline utilization regulon repressor / proline dehydrogenase / delta 1-pyrroline-5-carboxylate dehydrogenase
MRYFAPPLTAHPLYPALNASRFAPEPAQVEHLLAALALRESQRQAILERARGWVRTVRARPAGLGHLDAFLAEYALDSREGIALLCLAEALLRVPDTLTLDELIRDKLGGTDWRRSGDGSASLFVNASTWALMLTGRLIEWRDDPAEDLMGALRRRLERGGEPLIREALRRAMGILGEQFVLGRTIGEALARAARGAEARYRHSFDMLGEAAHTAQDAARYQQRYLEAIAAVGRSAGGLGPVAGPGVSIKLSALHPRLEPAQGERVRSELLPRLLELALAAKAAAIGLTIDAEEAARLDLSLDLFAALCAEPALAGWEGLGIAVQAYQRRALPLIDLLGTLADRHGRRILVRLVKGAYWDSEIKWAQQQGLPGYPVYTRKVHTDLSYLACARRLLELGPRVYPQLATHNAHTVAAILELAGDRPFELQRLHGMGEALYDLILGESGGRLACRAYDPVGSHQDLLPYLVRRLLENGANSSFVNRIADARSPVEQVVTDPVDRVRVSGCGPAPRIPDPRDLFRPDRANSAGLDLSDPDALAKLSRAMHQAIQSDWTAAPLLPAGRWEASPAQCSTRRIAAAPLAGSSRRARPSGGGPQRGPGRCAGLEQGRCRRAGSLSGASGGPARGTPGRARGPVLPGGRQDHPGRHRGGPGGDGLLSLLRGPGPEAARGAAPPSGTHRRAQPALAARARGLRLHQPLELPPGDLPGSGQRRPGGRQPGDRQARRADALDRGARGSAAP